MGLDVKRNKKGLYKAKSSISGKSVNGDGWVTEDEFKKILIDRAFFKFIEETIRIDMEFPSGYGVNGNREIIDEKHNAGSEWMIKNWNDEAFNNKFKEICERLKIESKF